VEYRPSDFRRYILGILFTLSSVAAVMAIFYAVSQGTRSSAIAAGSLTALAMAFWWGLLSWTPTIVSVSQGMLEVAQGSNGERWDLKNPSTDIAVGSDPKSRSWKAVITRPNGGQLIIGPAQVKPEEFSKIVAYYRRIADGERSKREGLRDL
jgi:hypothetical protein